MAGGKKRKRVTKSSTAGNRVVLIPSSEPTPAQPPPSVQTDLAPVTTAAPALPAWELETATGRVVLPSYLTKITPRQTAFLRVLALAWPNIDLACRRSGIPREVYDHWFERHRHFSAAVGVLKQAQLDEIETTAWQEAKTPHGTYDRWKLLTAHRKKDYGKQLILKESRELRLNPALLAIFRAHQAKQAGYSKAQARKYITVEPGFQDEEQDVVEDGAQDAGT